MHTSPTKELPASSASYARIWRFWTLLGLSAVLSALSWWAVPWPWDLPVAAGAGIALGLTISEALRG